MRDAPDRIWAVPEYNCTVYMSGNSPITAQTGPFEHHRHGKAVAYVRAGLFDKDSDYGGMMGDAVMKMIEAFSEDGHSGFSAGMAISLFSRLARYEPLSPLTGDDDEWNEVGSGVYQNRRCLTVFKDADGVYDINGRIFREPSGACYTSRDSRVPVVFPYTPSSEYVDVDE